MMTVQLKMDKTTSTQMQVLPSGVALSKANWRALANKGVVEIRFIMD
jgi:hypothetical protein